MRVLASVIAAIALLGVMPKATFDPGALAIGKPATGVPHTDGRPLAIVVFASWCVGCIDELPRELADYAKLKDRVDFLGVDYLDAPQAGAALVQRYHIPFPVVYARPQASVPQPERPGASNADGADTVSIVLNGVTPAMLPVVVPKILPHLLPDGAATLRDVAAYCAQHDATTCVHYAASKHVVLASAVLSATPMPVATQEPASSHEPIALPHLFIVDAAGIVRFAETGYNSGDDTLIDDLAKLGITAQQQR